MTVKLTLRQQEVVDLLSNGWSLGLSTGYMRGAWIQEGKIGYGGRTKNVSVATVYALVRKKVIVGIDYSYPSTSYGLSKEWKNDETILS